jgi:hypothetical protein
MPVHEEASATLEVLLDHLIVLVRRTQDGPRASEFTLLETLLQRVELDEVVLRIHVMEGYKHGHH